MVSYLFLFLVDQVLEIEEELDQMKKDYKDLELQRKRDVKVLQDKVDRLEEELRQLRKDNDVLEKRNSKISDQMNYHKDINVGSTIATGSGLKKTGNKAETVSHNKEENSVSLKPKAKTNTTNKSITEKASEGEKSLSHRDLYIQEQNISIIEGKLDETDDDLKEPQTSKLPSKAKLSFISNDSSQFKEELTSKKPGKKSLVPANALKQSTQSKNAYVNFPKESSIQDTSLSPRSLAKSNISESKYFLKPADIHLLS